MNQKFGKKFRLRLFKIDGGETSGGETADGRNHRGVFFDQFEICIYWTFRDNYYFVICVMRHETQQLLNIM